MGIIAINRLVHERPGPVIGGDGNREYNVRWEVITDTLMNGDQVGIASGLPRLYYPHPENLLARVTDIDPQQSSDSDYYWTIEYRYSTKLDKVAQPDIGQSPSNPNDPNTDAGNTNPLLRPPQYKFTSRRYTEAVINDILTGEVLQNSAQDPYDPLMEERSRLVLTVERNLHPLLFNPLAITDYVWATNQSPYLGWNDHEVLLEDLEGEPKWEQGVPFWAVRAVFVFSTITTINGVEVGGWYTRKLDAGFNKLVSGALVPIFVRGQKPTKPQLLDGAGGVLAVGGTPHYNRFDTKFLRNFNDLNLF